MHDTLPPILSVWSELAAPLCCLASKSQARLCSESLQSALEANLNGPGSTIYQTVWKPHTTPLGRQIYRLRASGRRTSDSEPFLVPSGWPSATTSDTRSYSETALTIWLEGETTNGHGMDLNMAGQLSGWATPVGQQANGTPEAFLERKRKSMANGSQSMGVCLSDLNMQVQAWAGWPTPTSRDHKDGKECPNVPLNALLGDKPHLTPHGAARITADGTMLTGCSAGMESGGQLNPAFSAWLMGFPEAWCHAAISCQLPIRSRKAPKKPAA